MRGFAFIGGDGPSVNTEIEILSTDIIVAADSGLDSLHARNRKAHWVVGDMDSLKNKALLYEYPEERIKTWPEDKDFTDTELAVNLLEELGCTEIILAGGGGGRIDHLLAVAALFERQRPPDRWLTRLEDIICLDNRGTKQSILIKAPSGTIVSVFPAGPGPWKTSSIGLKWSLEGLAWTRGSFGISNKTESESSRIDVKEGRFLVILPLGTRWSML